MHRIRYVCNFLFPPEQQSLQAEGPARWARSEQRFCWGILLSRFSPCESSPADCLEENSSYQYVSNCVQIEWYRVVIQFSPHLQLEYFCSSENELKLLLPFQECNTQLPNNRLARHAQ